MTIKFRPQLLALEARDVPAAFSFRLPDGTTGNGTFATPDALDATQASQALAVPDLTVTRGGVNLVVQPGATANNANGVLVGVTASAIGPGDPVVLNNALVQVGGSVVPVAYDAADTRYTFQFSNGVGGNISFTFDWNQVNPDLASQALVLERFSFGCSDCDAERRTTIVARRSKSFVPTRHEPLRTIENRSNGVQPEPRRADGIRSADLGCARRSEEEVGGAPCSHTSSRRLVRSSRPSANSTSERGPATSPHSSPSGFERRAEFRTRTPTNFSPGAVSASRATR